MLPRSPGAVDTHAHVFRRGLPVAAGARYVPDYDATLDAWLAQLDAAGVARGVLVQVSFLGHDNACLLEALDAGRNRLRGVVQCAPTTDEATLDDWHRRGVRGVRVNTIGAAARPEPGSREWRDFLARIGARGWHLEVHDEGEGLAALLRSLEGCPAPVVVDHFGYPAQPAGYRAMLALAQRQPVYAKLSAPYRLGGADPARWAADLLARLGPQRLMWGSDWPHTRHERAAGYGPLRAALDAWIPDPVLQRTILCETPARIFGF